MSLYVKVSNSVMSSSAVDGRWYASTSVPAPTGYFVVGGGYWYDTPYGAGADVRVSEDAYRSFNGGTENLPTEYETALSAGISGTLYIYAVCRELP